jgi:ribulose 1,5-bisphosphate synthetase/thiazole synthase
MIKKTHRVKTIVMIIASMLFSCQNNKDPNAADVVIYGGTSAGISAAIQTARLGKSVILIEPTNRLGGLTTGGLGQTDIGNKQVIGGISREFYRTELGLPGGFL